MILLIDIGNTNTVCALYDNNTYIKSKRIEQIENTHTTFEIFLNYDIKFISICSVVPNSTNIYINKIKKIFKIDPFIVSHKNSNITLKVDEPNEVGADRICNIKAAIKKIEGACIVIDFGTATTYDIINKRKEFIGGAIAPGIDVSANYLIKKAALLKETILEFPKEIIGKNTKTNIQSGVMYGAIYSIEGMIKHIISELEENTTIILTGGFSSLISPKLSIKHILDSTLTLDGIRIIHEENHEE